MVARQRRPESTSRLVSATSGRTAPDGSVTTPVRLAPVPWAAAGSAVVKTAASTATAGHVLHLPHAADVEWGVYDLQGRRMWSETRAGEAGAVTLAWDGSRAAGGRVDGGVYFARVRVDGRELTRRFAIVR